MTRVPLVLLLCISAAPLHAAKLTRVNVLDRDYLVVQISDGDVTHNENPAPETISRYTPELNTTAAVSIANWTITSSQDGNYGGAGAHDARLTDDDLSTLVRATGDRIGVQHRRTLGFRIGLERQVEVEADHSASQPAACSRMG